MPEIRSHYSDFWIQFQKVMHGLSGACQCHPRGELWLEPNDTADREHGFFLKEPILLKGLPCKSLTGHLDAIIDYEERFPKRPFDVPARTSINVHYYLRAFGNNHIAQQLYSLRFDYHPGIGSEDGDPITHAHINSEQPRKLPAPYRAVEFEQNGSVDGACFKLLGYGRMPTPRMPLPGVLCLLIADHFRSGVRILIDKTRGALNSVAVPLRYANWHRKCDCHRKSDSIGWAWYEY